MYYYKIFDLPFKSNFELSALKQIDNSEYSFEVLRVNIVPKLEDIEWYLKIPYQNHNNKTFAEFGKNKNYFIVRFNNYLDFFISKNLKKVFFSDKNNLDNNTVQHLLVDQVIPRIISDSKKIVVHASAIEYENMAFAFVGESGSGKSTLVFLLEELKNKFNVICDDTILIENRENKFLVHSSYSGIRLWPESLSAKKEYDNYQLARNVSEINNKIFLSSKNFNNKLKNKSKLLKTIYILEPSNTTDTKIVEISPGRAFEEITKSIFRLDTYNKEHLINEFNFVTQLIDNINLFKINYKKDFSLVENYRNKILENIVGNC